MQNSRRGNRKWGEKEDLGFPEWNINFFLSVVDQLGTKRKIIQDSFSSVFRRYQESLKKPNSTFIYYTKM